MKQLKEKVDIGVTIVASAVILFGAVTNSKQFICEVIPQIVNSNVDTIEENLSEAENNYQTNFYKKNIYADIYGITQKVLSRQLIGNFEYVLDDDGVINMIRENDYDVDKFVGNVEHVKTLADEHQTNFLYMQGANREFVLDKYPEEYSFNIDNDTMNEICSKMSRLQINVLDERSELLNGKTNFDLDDVFFHTDLHMQTDAEIWVANNLAQHLIDNYGVRLDNINYLSDMGNYQKDTYSFVGNYARSVGKYFTEEDKFDIYKPSFNTDFTYQNWTTGESVSGNFEQVLMNGYENNTTDEYTYWVTDYLHYGMPYYSIYNNQNQDAAKILFITDSMGYRTMSYLALTASEVTVLDPRFFNGINYIDQALNEQSYDMIIVYQGTFLMDYDFFF